MCALVTSVRPPPRAKRSMPSGSLGLLDVLIFAGIGAALLVYFAGIYPLRGYYFPVGPDVPVYLWWTKLAAHDGLSAVGVRPGVPTLSLVLQGSLGLSPPQALAGVGTSAATSVGLAAAALVAVPLRVAGGTAGRRVVVAG